MKVDWIADFDKKVFEHGFIHWGFSNLKPSLTLEHYRTWLENSFHGEMEYLEKHLSYKNDPSLLLDKANSVLSFAYPYNPHEFKDTFIEDNLSHLKIAKYAKGKDYHFWLKQKLLKLEAYLKDLFPQENFISYTDSGPILERNYAYQSGLGWFGKNSCLINRSSGSFFFIAEIITSLDLSNDNTSLSPDFCGKCTKCIDACPTQAIVQPKVIDAKKCISYWNIESKENPPLNIREKLSDHFFGCDICQDVCPWNIKNLKKSFELKTDTDNDAALIKELSWVLTSSKSQITKKLKETPLIRAGALGLKRNACIVAANKNIKALVSDIKKAQKDYPELEEISLWALSKLET